MYIARGNYPQANTQYCASKVRANGSQRFSSCIRLWIVSEPPIWNRNTLSRFTRKPANVPNYRGREGPQSDPPRRTALQFHRRPLCGKPQGLRNKSRVMELYCDRRIHKFLVLRIVTYSQQLLAVDEAHIDKE